MKKSVETCEVLVVGGGPAGATVARLLAARGHDVLVVSRAIDDRRGIAESLPPSTRKVLAAIGAIDALEASGASLHSGNRVWWGADDRVEDFGGEAGGSGFQIWRPDFDRLLARLATDAGVRWHTGNVQRIQNVDDNVSAIVALAGGGTAPVSARFVVDATGRSGVLARRQRDHAVPYRTHAWMGRWERAPEARADGDTRTLVETTDQGWAWSVPVSPTVRCATVMIDPERSRIAKAGPLESRYRAELARAVRVHEKLRHAVLVDVWGCDASLYETRGLVGTRHLVVGDAASFIDPLSSFGVKKALTSAWMGAAVVHTVLVDPGLWGAARDLFSAREREAYATSVGVSADYARLAADHHQTPFWTARRSAWVERRTAPTGQVDLTEASDVRRAFDELRQLTEIRLRPSPSFRFAWQPAFRGDRVVLERAVAVGTRRQPVRFVDNVDLTGLVEIAGHYRQIGDLFDGYCRRAAPVPLPNFLKALSVLVARRVLEPAELTSGT